MRLRSLTSVILTMNSEEAREKFGKYSEGPNGEEQWEFDHNKLRGLFLKYSRDIDYLQGTSERPVCESWIDNFWQWLKANLGVGYKGVIQCSDPSPSGKFDRLGKSEAMRIADAYYDNHDEFKENMDELWEQVDKTAIFPATDDSYIEFVRDMSNDELLETFFNIYDRHDSPVVGKRQSPNVEGYKFHIKQWVLETKTIQSETEKPSAEALVEEWIDWIVDEVLSLPTPIVERNPEDKVGGVPIPEQDDIVGWCRELWQDSEEFRENVKEKWNKEVEGDEKTMPVSDDVDSVREGIDTTRRNKRGQTSLTDHSG